jgi:precorrin-6x reductase
MALSSLRKASIEFIVLRQSGGRWKFKVQLEATEPEEDDVIVISSPLNRTTSVSFKLTNKVKAYSRFLANFSPESDAEFSVMPKQ